MSASEAPITWLQQDTDRWLSVADQRERSLRPILERLLADAAPQQGERALDVGCGTGPTTAALADAVLPGGHVVGLDLAPELLEVARRRVTGDGVDWLVGDATTVELPAARADLVLSRFGVMFFADPVAAFTHLAEATRPGGRLVMSVWPPRTEVEQFTLPYEAARRALDRAGAAYDEPPPDRGPFSLGDRTRIAEVLGASGWGEVEIDSPTVSLPVGGPGSHLGDLARQSLGTGHAGVLLEGRPDQVWADAERDLADVLGEYAGPGGVRVPSVFRLVRARRR